MASALALVPVWFLSVYLLIVAAVPWTQNAWDRLGMWSVWLLVGAAITVDVLRFKFGIDWIGWSNYAFVWLAIHQFGYA